MTRGTGHQKVRHLRQIHHKRFVIDGFAQSDRQSVIVFRKLVGGDDFAHGDDVGVLVRNLDADGTATRNRRDDTDTQCGEAQRDIILQILDFADANTLFRHNFIQGNGRADHCGNALDGNAEAEQGLLDTHLVLKQFLADKLFCRGGIGIIFQQLHRREFEVRELFARVVGF